MWEKVGPRMFETVLLMNIPIEKLPWADGRLDVVKLLEGYERGKA